MTKHPYFAVAPPQAANRPTAIPERTAGLRALARLRVAGVSLVEVMIAVAILGLVSGASLWALSSDNRVAALNRYMIAAKMVAQARVDEAQSVTYTITGTVPAVLATGTTTSLVTIADGTPPLNGTMTTTAAVADSTLGLRRVRVVVNWVYRGRPYSVTLATARAPD